MKISKAMILMVQLSGCLLSAYGQATFQNRGFEAANLPAIPSGQPGVLVPIREAMPGWTGYAGSNGITQVLHNDLTLGAANISILGPDWPASEIIAGKYSAVLQ